MPRGTIDVGERWVESTPILIPGQRSTCSIRGRFDAIVRLDDGSYAVIDLKTCDTRDDHLFLYSRQLHAYAHALEHAAPRWLSLKPITRLGLLVFEPNGFGAGCAGSVSLYGPLTWIEIPLNKDRFERFLGEVMDVLDAPDPPPPSPTCSFCKYRGLPR